jgi:hypothetical protein
MPKYACRKDSNHNKIKRTFLLLGWSVLDTSTAPGLALDLIVWRGNTIWKRLWFIEIKSDSKAPLTEREIEFMTLHKDESIKIWCVEQVEALTRLEA